MKNQLKVLIVEDSGDDVMLLVRELRRGGFDAVYKRVDTPEDMRVALSGRDWDIVLSDFRMPRFDAPGALKVLKESGQDIPFIVISGTVGEDVAVETMRLGANDYIMKSNLVRLVPAIRRELQEMEGHRQHRLTLDSLEESQEKFEILFNGNNDAIFIADPETRILVDCNRQAERMTGYPREKILSMRADQLHPQDAVDATMKFFEDQAAGWSGIVESELLTALGRKIPVSINAAMVRIEGRAYLQGIFRDISEQKKAEREMRESYDRMQKVMEGVIHAMVATVEMRDPYTAGHQRRVARLATAMAAGMGLSAMDVEGVHMAAVIHDLGKIYVPSEILAKPGRISEMEFSMIKMHPRVGYDILKKIEFPWPVADIVLQHHERMDGSGYPGGLKGEAILVQARIIAVADVVEAMASHRPYRPALGIDVALDEISKGSGTRYDGDAAARCEQMFGEKDFKFAE
ncbi:MAG: HD domain-containing phosphohydrolase [Pseudomonadota bacterium]